MAAYRENGSQTARIGSALALKACAPQLNAQQVPEALDFLLGYGLADADEDVRGQMVAAGATYAPLHTFYTHCRTETGQGLGMRERR